jgi:predicted nucleotidyltransferase
VTLIPAEQMAQRAARWAWSQDCVRAAVVYGSVALGTADDDSDLDLVLVAEPGRRDELWQRRGELAECVHDGPQLWAQEPSWQRSFRYASWGQDLTRLDLTVDEAHAAVWPAMARGFRLLCDKADVADRLAEDLAGLAASGATTSAPAGFDPAVLDGGTWAWLRYLQGKLRHGETWLVRYGVMDTLSNRVVPLLGSAAHSAVRELGPELTGRLNAAAPVSAEPAELRRSLLATAELYDWALSRWSARTGQPDPRSAIAGPVLERLRHALAVPPCGSG